jgi:hypothetical protein
LVFRFVLMRLSCLGEAGVFIFCLPAGKKILARSPIWAYFSQEHPQTIRDAYTDPGQPGFVGAILSKPLPLLPDGFT